MLSLNGVAVRVRLGNADNGFFVELELLKKNTNSSLTVCSP